MEENTATMAAANEPQNEAEVMNTAIDAAVSEAIGKAPEEVPPQEIAAEPKEETPPAKKTEVPPAKEEPAAKAEGEPTPEKKEDLPTEPVSAAAEEPDDEMGKAIAEMENDKDEDGNSNYDPKILKILKGLYAENQKLRSAGESAARQTFFDKQFGSLDEGVRSHVDAPHKSQLKAKFDMLTAGYKATNAKISQEAVFQEAAKLALGDLMEKAAEERKATALEERRRIALARPGGESGQVRRNGPVTEEDIASEIWDQLNK